MWRAFIFLTAGLPAAFLAGYLAGQTVHLELSTDEYRETLTRAAGMPGNWGRAQALQKLNAAGETLEGVDLAGAALQHVSLTSADLSGANFTESDLSGCDLSDARMWGANLQGAYLGQAKLCGAQVHRAALAGASLIRADLEGLEGWETITDVRGLNVFEVRNAPPGFVEWALENGAVSVPHKEWLEIRDNV